MPEILLTVSGVVDSQLYQEITAGQKPTPDFLAMARAFGATLLDYTTARNHAGPIGRRLEKIGGPNLMLAWSCFRQRRNFSVIFTDGEQIGIPLAFFMKYLGWLSRKRPRHLMITHILSTRKKELFFDLLRIHSHIDIFFVYSTWQKQFIETRWKLPATRVVFTPFMVDSHFFDLGHVKPERKQMICAVGLERRDYPTLIEAVKDLDVQVVIAAASPWSKQADTTAGQVLPSNVTVRRFSQYELRQLYADSRMLVMPLYDVEFQAGVTAILEAMSMQRAVICSRTRGQTDVIVDEKTGLYVPPGNPQALRAAIKRLLDSPAEADQMGLAGRQLVEQKMSQDSYIVRLQIYVQAARGRLGGAL
jgi:glycosyltransferase involved in cell wall biosynthesis